MKTEKPNLDLEYMELDEENHLTDREAFVLGVVAEQSYGLTEEREWLGT